MPIILGGHNFHSKMNIINHILCTRSNAIQHDFSFLREMIKVNLSFTTIAITIILFVEILTAIYLMEQKNNHDTDLRTADK
jgi:hypothetical protein